MTTFDNVPLVLTPFADDDSSKDFSFFESGITRQMTSPTENGGARFTRHQMNGIGYLATLGAFLDRIGYPYGKERLDPTSFGGYPKGAILTTQDNGYVREYVSLIDNNTHPLPTEADDGTYEGNEYWAPTIPTESASFYPDFSDKTLVNSGTIGPVNNSNTEYKDFSIGESGWYLLTRTLSSKTASGTDSTIFDSLKLVQIRFSVSVNGSGIVNGTSVAIEQLDGILGAQASCMLPLSKGNLVRTRLRNEIGTREQNLSLYCNVTIEKLKSIELQ